MVLIVQISEVSQYVFPSSKAGFVMKPSGGMWEGYAYRRTQELYLPQTLKPKIDYSLIINIAC